MQDEPNKKINRAKDDENLLFARGEVIRLMKDHLDKDKMITERVKVEMNRFLSNVLVAVCEELNKYPYITIDYKTGNSWLSDETPPENDTGWDPNGPDPFAHQYILNIKTNIKHLQI